MPSVFETLAQLHPDGLLGVALEEGRARVVFEDALAQRLLQRSVLGPLEPDAFPGAEPLLQAAREALRRRAGRGEPVERELTLEAGVLRVRAVVARSEEAPGEGPRVALFLEDVSLTRAFERELRRSRELMYALIEATTDAVYVKDPAGHYLFINAAGARAMGRTVSSVVGHTDAQLLPPAEAATTRAHDLEVLARREVVTYEDPGDAAGTAHLWQSTKGVLMHPDGSVRALFGTSRDITERRRAQRLHERLLGILGHDLRSPLTALGLDLLQLRRRGASAPLVERLARTERRVERLVALLLDYTQLHAGQPLLLDRREVDARELVEEALRETRSAHPPREVEVVGAGVRVSLDPPRMTRVLGQLLDNALRHSPAGSPVTVVLREEGAELRVLIHNEGAPIPLERLQHLFEEGEQPQPAAVEETVRLSLGLGLHVARATVEAHGGHLEIRSTEGMGTLVTLRLPRA